MGSRYTPFANRTISSILVYFCLDNTPWAWFLLQVASAPMDAILASASTIPIVVLCYVEAFNSGKLVTNAAMWFYLVCLFATLFLILAHHVWNQIEVRKIWKSRNELYEEKKILETILLDMLPPEYAEKIVRSIDIGGKRQKAVVLFSDLQGYSKLNERMSPHDVICTPLSRPQVQCS